MCFLFTLEIGQKESKDDAVAEIFSVTYSFPIYHLQIYSLSAIRYCPLNSQTASPLPFGYTTPSCLYNIFRQLAPEMTKKSFYALYYHYYTVYTSTFTLCFFLTTDSIFDNNSIVVSISLGEYVGGSSLP